MMPRSLVSNAAWNASGTLFGIVLTFLLAPLLIHRLGVDRWGLLLLVWSLSGVLGIANFGLGEATLRFVAHHHAKGDLCGVNRVLGATLTYYVSVCVFITGLLWMFAPTVAQWVKVPPGNQYPLEALVRMSALLFSVGMISNAYRAIPMALHRYDISNKIGSTQAVLRSLGLLLLAVAHFDVLVLVAWELLVVCLVLVVHVIVARRMLPGLRWLPSMSIIGLREIIGYSMYSFLTHVFLMAWRELPKLLLGNRLGTSSVAYLGTPDSIAHRLHMIMVSAIETLVPRFSRSNAEEHGKDLLTLATWAAFVCAAVLYVPLGVLMPDFLRLWISPEFARESGLVGQLIAFSLVGPASFAPIATLYRGIGRPGFVTAVMAILAGMVLALALALMPTFGVKGVAFAYLAGTGGWLGGLGWGWVRLYGWRSSLVLMRIAGLPLGLGCGLVALDLGIRGWWGAPGWAGLFGMGAVFAGLGAIVVLSVDVLLGGASPARQVLARFRSVVRAPAADGART